MRRIPGIDGLRAIAVVFVILEHYIFSYLLRAPTNIGEIGVSIFFVISGYLISGILLSERDHPVSVARKLEKFYIRRTIRIFPIYYLTIAVGIASGIYWFSIVNPLWYFGYATNWLMAIRNDGVGYASHFWSLGVEEQFYLVWPLLIFSLPKRSLPLAIGLCTAIGPITYCVEPIFHFTQLQLYVLPFTHLDALGSGALLAYVHRNLPAARSANIQGTFAPLLLVFLIAFLVNQSYREDLQSSSNLFMVWSSTLLTAAAIHSFWNGTVPVLTRFLETSSIRWIGRTSYGLYLYHNLVPEMFVGTPLSPRLPPTVWHMLVYLATSLILTAVSWFLIEAPLNKRKERVVMFVDRIFRRKPETQNATP